MIESPAVKEAPVNEFAGLYDQQLLHWRAWVKHSTASHRIQKLKTIRKWIFSHQQDIRDAIYKDFKKPPGEVDLSEILPVVGEINHTIAHLHEWMRPKPVPAPLTMLGTTSKVIYEAKGVTLIIGPWNYPFMLAVGPLISAVSAGCCAVVKPSEMTPHTADLIERMVKELFKEDEVAVRKGDASVAQGLLALPFHHIFFTGSPQVGKIIMKAAANHLASVTLELGGENPAIVDETASIEDAGEKLIWGKFLNNGQSCMSPNYVFVHKSKKAALITSLEKWLGKIYGPDPTARASTPDIARKVNLHHYMRVRDLIEDAKAKGAKVLVGDAYNDADCYIEPTILVDVPENARTRNEEIFGPVMQLVEYDNLDEVLEYINSKPNSLGLYIFSRSRKNIHKITSHTNSGTVAVNETTLPFAHVGLPFGGNGYSGIGKAHGYQGFLAFTHEKAWLRQRVGLTTAKSFYPPFTNLKMKLIQFVVKFLG
ncbi:MAG: aldehyde dehydrogenase family protein [Bacteroidia bacterium]|nr:aldehyde dehydrogenase family protein [Bacteroidia bacterium]